MHLSKITNLPDGVGRRKPVILRLVFLFAIGKSKKSENFFLIAPGAFCTALLSPGGRPDPDGLTSLTLAAATASGDDRDRTGNLRLAKPALSQLSYVPEPAEFLIYDF